MHPLLGDSALSYNPTSIGDMIVSSWFHPEDLSSMHLRPTHALGTKKKWRSKSPRTSPPSAHAWSIHLGPRAKKTKSTGRERQSPRAIVLTFCIKFNIPFFVLIDLRLRRLVFTSLQIFCACAFVLLCTVKTSTIVPPAGQQLLL